MSKIICCSNGNIFEPQHKHLNLKDDYFRALAITLQ